MIFILKRELGWILVKIYLLSPNRYLPFNPYLNPIYRGGWGWGEYNNYCKDFKIWIFLKEVFYSQFLCSNLCFISEVFESNLSSTLFYFHLQTLSFNPTYYSLGFCKEKFFKREFVVFWSPSDYCTCGCTTSGLEECDWGVGYSLVIVIICENSSGSEILLGEAGT